MADFTSALYLGLRHSSGSLRPWDQLTAGKPAALGSSPGAVAVASQLAALLGCERATLVPSTLHLFWDLFTILASERIVIYMDTGAYAIVKWGVERAAAGGTAVRTFRHHDPGAMRAQVQRDARRGLRPVVVRDGLCPACGGPAPIESYLAQVRPYGGYVVLDDTQALGILGQKAKAAAPYGSGGGGSLRWSHIYSPDLIVGSSMAKGFGVPVAVLAGSEKMVRRFEQASSTRIHCSPPSNAVVHAADHALSVNRQQGDHLRLRLWQLVSRFKKGLAEAGLSTHGGDLPVQTWEPSPESSPVGCHNALLQRGISSVLHLARHGFQAQISFLITALHRVQDIDHATDALKDVTQRAISPGFLLEKHYEKSIQF
ncbi:MAG: pyridoxal phosphate-dependent aminotransferase family protein [Nitrospira sp.]|nr:pyridoxal phosphate-dependent aminotransferase family protein [Nitrospira sp.]MBX3348951.1 pyridoxal phosphate-dependent aminotransferase family protein [Nitrospira sp.]